MVGPLIIPTKPEYEVADVFRLYGESYRNTHRLSLEQLKAMSAIEACRTAVLGGHVDQCDQCGALRISYNSCRNRHCPKCGALAKERWLARQQADLLPIEYFHLVFTIDHKVNRLASFNEQAIYNLLFHSATETLKAFGQKYLGGEIGITAILHTWGQNLSQHIHLHCIVTGGALSADGKKWQSAQKDFLFPVVELSAAFRQRFCAGLKKLHAKGRLQFPDEMVNLQSSQAFDVWVAGIASKRWQVYVKESWGHPEEVLAYFGRYTHRIAISNSRILGIENGRVRFTWKDYRDNGKTKVMTLTAEEFIRRFLQHVLPHSFVRMRHYGLLHGVQRRKKLRRVRQLLGVASNKGEVEITTDDLIKQLTGIDPRRCPVCGKGQMVAIGELPPMRWKQKWRGGRVVFGLPWAA